MRSPKLPPSPSDAEWLAHVDAQARSGFSVPKYSRQHGLKADTFYKRRRRHAVSRLVPIAVETATSCELAFPDGRILRFPATLSPDVLSAIAREQLGLDALRSAVVLFVNRDRTRCKLFFHDGSGVVIVYKRLDRGVFRVPHATLPGDRSVRIEPRELAIVLAGLEHR